MEQLFLFLDLTIEQSRLAVLLRKGRRNARTVKDLSRSTGINERRVRQLVRHLIDDHGYCIGSATAHPAGYYLIDDKDELERFVRVMRHRGISILVRAAHVTGNSPVEVFNQGMLEFLQEAPRK